MDPTVTALACEVSVRAYLSDRKMNGAAAKSLTKYATTLGEFSAWAGDRAPGDVTGPSTSAGVAAALA